MTKWVMMVVLAILVGGSWVFYSMKGNARTDIQRQIEVLQNQGDPEEKLPELEGRAKVLDDDKTLAGILLTFMSAGLVGIVLVVYVLPFFAQRVTHAVYDSAEMVEKDVMHDARSLLAQGDYSGAIDAFKKAAAADPMNRLPWVEITKIYKDNLGDSASAIATIRHALESQAWEQNDAAYFLFRLAELYDQLEGNRAAAIAIMNQVVQQFPGTRHSANANHKLHEWAAQEEDAAIAAAGSGVTVEVTSVRDIEAEEREYLERMRAAELASGGDVPQDGQPGDGDQPRG